MLTLNRGDGPKSHGALRARDTALGGRRLRCLGGHKGPVKNRWWQKEELTRPVKQRPRHTRPRCELGIVEGGPKSEQVEWMKQGPCLLRHARPAEVDPGAKRCAEAIERKEPTGFICWHCALRARDTALGERRLRCLGGPTV